MKIIKVWFWLFAAFALWMCVRVGCAKHNAPATVEVETVDDKAREYDVAIERFRETGEYVAFGLKTNKLSPPPTTEELNRFKFQFDGEVYKICELIDGKWEQRANVWDSKVDALWDVAWWIQNSRPAKPQWEDAGPVVNITYVVTDKLETWRGFTTVATTTNAFAHYAHGAPAVTNPYVVVWQFDATREMLKQYDDEIARAREFNLTNTDPYKIRSFPPYYYYKNQISAEHEFGYRLDGAVVWRVPPEVAK